MINLRLILSCSFLNGRKSLFVEVQYFIHLNLSLALLAVYIIFVAGIETARTNEVRTHCVVQYYDMQGCALDGNTVRVNAVYMMRDRFRKQVHVHV